MNSCFHYRHVHVLLIIRMGRIRWNSSNCRVMYCIGYHLRFPLISICVASSSSRYVGLSFKFNPVFIFIATSRKRISLQYRCVSTYVFVHPYVPSERCEINRNIDHGVIYGV